MSLFPEIRLQRYKIFLFYLHCQIEIMLQSTLNQRPRLEVVICLINIFYESETDGVLLFMVWYKYILSMGSLFIHCA